MVISQVSMVGVVNGVFQNLKFRMTKQFLASSNDYNCIKLASLDP
jgi:hypothetical protein